MFVYKAMAFGHIWKAKIVMKNEKKAGIQDPRVMKMNKYRPECKVCHREFNVTSRIPRVLQCGHSICEQCANRLQDDYRYILCPFCEHITPDDEEVGFPRNYDLLSVICQ
uniref:RING-type domain-containing protein n=1 Tax=Caenorhabditis tropicalis TaxID=1561998 RepID=A0A1I7UYP7_9PELO